MKPFEFKVTVEVERETGKFASRSEIFEKLLDEIQSADPGTVDGDEGGEYSVISWEVEEA